MKSQIVDDNIARQNQIFQKCEKYNFDSLCNDFKRTLRENTFLKRDEFFRNIIRLRANADYSEFVELMKAYL